MTTPPLTPTNSGQIEMPATPKKSRLKTAVMTIVILIAAGFSGYYGWLWYQNRNGTTTNAPTTTDTAAGNTDTVTTQLRSVSNSTDTSTIKAEIADTPTSDIATELDNIDAEVTGL